MKSILLVWMFISSFLLFFTITGVVKPQSDKQPERVLDSVRI